MSFSDIAAIIVYVTFLVLIVVVIVNIVVDGLNLLLYLFKIIRRKYQRNHRFDKKPIAKCYCVDCSSRTDDGKCEIFRTSVADDGFCKWGK